jgi:hypothetical protein
MTNQAIDQRLRNLALVAQDTDCHFRALVRLLIEKKVLEGTEEEVLEELRKRAVGIAHGLPPI